MSIRSSVRHVRPPSVRPVRPPFVRSVGQSVRLSVRSFVRPIRPFVRPSVRLSVRPSVRSSIRPSVRPSVHPSVRLSVRSTRPSVRSVRPSVLPTPIDILTVYALATCERRDNRQLAVTSVCELIPHNPSHLTPHLTHTTADMAIIITSNRRRTHRQRIQCLVVEAIAVFAKRSAVTTMVPVFLITLANNCTQRGSTLWDDAPQYFRQHHRHRHRQRDLPPPPSPSQSPSPSPSQSPSPNMLLRSIKI